MIYSINNQKFDTDELRERLLEIKAARMKRNYVLADSLRTTLLSRHPAFRLAIGKDGHLTLWDIPTPPLTNQFHYANFPEFIANTRE